MDEGRTWKPDVTDYRQGCVSRMSQPGFLLARALGAAVLPSGLREMMAESNFDTSTTAVIGTDRRTRFFFFF